MIKMPQPYALPPKIETSGKYFGMKTPYWLIPIILSIFAMIANVKHWFFGWQWLWYFGGFSFIVLMIYSPEDESIGEMFALILKNFYLNKRKDFEYFPNQNFVFTPEWTIKSIKKDEE